MAFEGWIDGVPPKEWKRALAIDVGGHSPWSFEWSALDPLGYLVVYQEIYETTTDVDKLAIMAMPYMRSPDHQEYEWLFKVCDYENRVAMEDLRKKGIVVTNAVKHSKLSSIHRLAGYLHPNPKRPFPSWHPRGGQPGSPLLFITQRCKNLIRELPQQRWKEGTGESLKDEPDRSIDNHATDALLYTVRMLPAPSEVKIAYAPADTSRINTISSLYWQDVKRRKEEKNNGERHRPYNSSHVRGGL